MPFYCSHWWFVAVAILLPGGSRPAHAARVERNVAVSMRDGVKLVADVYRPDLPGRYPVLVHRTPYGRKPARFAAPYVKAGYIVVTQDARGRYDSAGEFRSFVHAVTHDAEDGYDTIEWAARLPESSGKVGTLGSSYDAFLQWRLAALQPPALVAMAASSIPARYPDLEGPGTIRPGRRIKWYHGVIAPDLRRHSGLPAPHTPAEANRRWGAGEKELLRFLPWIELPDEFWGSRTEAEANRAWLREPWRDPWQLAEAAPRITVPNLAFVGWYDHCNGAIDIHQAMAARGGSAAARENQRLVIGPWNHSGLGNRKAGAIDFGPGAAVNLVSEHLRWFDHWLKGAPGGAATSGVRFFVMGRNEWREAPQWPPSAAKPRELFLASGGRAATPAGDGQLLPAGAAPAAGENRFIYDPRDPVPTLWGPALFTVPADQSPLNTRSDILVYQTEPLAAEWEVIGYPEVELFAASSAPDTDFFVRLIDVAPDGKAIDVASGMVRARYRESRPQPKLLVPGQPTRFHVRMRPTAHAFQPGHRIRLDVTSSDFPNYDRNHNTAANPNLDAELAVAENIVFHGGARASRLLLPVTPVQAGGGRN